MSTQNVPMLVISGPPGVGKSTVSWEIFDRLVARGSSPALADLDLLGASWPIPDDDPFNERMRAANLRDVWANFQAAGSTCLVVDGVIESREHLARYVAAIPHARATLCRLAAGDDDLRGRIRRRGRERGDMIEKLGRRAVELARQFERDDCADVVVDTADRDVAEVASRVLAATGWPARGIGG